MDSPFPPEFCTVGDGSSGAGNVNGTMVHGQAVVEVDHSSPTAISTPPFVDHIDHPSTANNITAVINGTTTTTPPPPHDDGIALRRVQLEQKLRARFGLFSGQYEGNVRECADVQSQLKKRDDSLQVSGVDRA